MSVSYNRHFNNLDNYLSDDEDNYESKSYLNFDMISISSSSTIEDLRNTVKQNAGKSYETISDSIFSKGNQSETDDSIDNYYYDTEIQTISQNHSHEKSDASNYEVNYKNDSADMKEPLAMDDSKRESDCYSFIIDLIVDYDEDIVSIISNGSKKFVINPEDLKPSIDSVLNISSKTQEDTKPVKKTIEKPARKVSPVTHESVQPKNSQMSVLPQSHKATINPTILKHSLPNFNTSSLARQSFDELSRSVTVSDGKYKNDLTVKLDDISTVNNLDDNDASKKSLKYRVVVTRKNIVKNVKRLSVKTFSRKSVYGSSNFVSSPGYDSEEHKSFLGNTKLFTAIKLVINKVNGNDRVGGVTKSGSSRPKSKSTTLLRRTASLGLLENSHNPYTLANHITKKENNHSSMALTRLSGNFHRTSNLEFKKGPSSQIHPPLPSNSFNLNPSITDSVSKLKVNTVLNSSTSNKNNIKVKKFSMLVKNPVSDLYNLYTIENPYADDSFPPGNVTRLSKVTGGIKLNDGNDRDQIQLPSNTTLIKDDSDSFIINYDIVESPVSKKSSRKSSPTKNALNEDLLNPPAAIYGSRKKRNSFKRNSYQDRESRRNSRDYLYSKSVSTSRTKRSVTSSQSFRKPENYSQPSATHGRPVTKSASSRKSSSRSSPQKKNSSSPQKRYQNYHKKPSAPLPAYKASQMSYSANNIASTVGKSLNRKSTHKRSERTVKGSTVMYNDNDNRKFFYA